MLTGDSSYLAGDLEVKNGNLLSLTFSQAILCLIQLLNDKCGGHPEQNKPSCCVCVIL